MKMDRRAWWIVGCALVIACGKAAPPQRGDDARALAPAASPEPGDDVAGSREDDVRAAPAHDARAAPGEATGAPAEHDAEPAADPPPVAVLGVWDKVPDAPWRAKATAMASDDPRRALCMGLMYERELCEGDACTCWVSPLGVAAGEPPLVGAALIGVSQRPRGYSDPTVEEWALVIATGERWVVAASAASYHEDKIGFYHRSHLALTRHDAGRALVRLDLVEAADDFGPGDSEIVREIAWSIVCGAREGEPRCVNVDRGVREGPTLESHAAVWRRDLEIGDDGRVTLGSIDVPDKVVGVRVAAGTYTLEALRALTLPPTPEGGDPHEGGRAQDDATPP